MQHAASNQSPHTNTGNNQHGNSIQNLANFAQADGNTQNAQSQPQQEQQNNTNANASATGGGATNNHHGQSQPYISTGRTDRTTKDKYSLEDFTLQRTLGTGSFGRVHLAQSNHNHRFYALKVLKKAQVVKMKQIEHTNDERRMLSRARHPFLVTLWGTWQDSRNLYMVMDFVEGGELFSLLRKSQVFYFPPAFGQIMNLWLTCAPVSSVSPTLWPSFMQPKWFSHSNISIRSRLSIET